MNWLKQWIEVGEQVVVVWVELGNFDIVEIMVCYGWIMLVIDGEYGVGDLDDWVVVVCVVEVVGGEVVLCVFDGLDIMLKWVLDWGFWLLIVLMVNIVVQVCEIVVVCCYFGFG